ncbi:MAG: serine hydrolase domain-containing protein, partial [Bacteroidia bacterium]
QKTYGLAYKNRKDTRELTDTTKFQLASVSKVITATAVLMLYEKGLINLDSTYTSYFPDFNYNTITIRQLLTHRSGLANYLYFMNTEIGTLPKLSNQEVYDQMCFKLPAPYLKPDRRFNYCNTNYALLALLVEKVSGMSFEDFLQKEIFNPLGMKNTCTINDIDSTEIAHAYNEKWRPDIRDASDYVLGDKSVFSTAYDMFLFSKALYQNKLLKEETQQLAYKAWNKERHTKNYGFGWRMRDFKDPVKKEVFHNGWWHGYRTAFHRRLHDKITIVVLSNQLNKTAYHTFRIYEILDNLAPSPDLVETDE